jgi:multiple sugar transport system substrate-binding protein
VSTPVLRAIGWDHPRCMSPMRACGAAWEQAGHAVLKWQARSLGSFGDQPLEEIAKSYDVLVIDHPFCGSAARSGCLLPIDQLVDPETLRALDAAAVGAAQRSYHYNGHTWGLASDAACQVSACRDDLLDGPLPASWPEALELAHRLGARAALPLAPAHAISSLLTLWAGAGLDPFAGGQLVDHERGLEQVEWLVAMHGWGNQAAVRWEPPETLAALAAGELAYVPLTYSFVSYSDRSHPGPRCRFADIPGVAGSVLGGAGLAVSAGSELAGEAAAFAAWVCGAEAQRGIVAGSGGQPANASCWDDAVIDADSGGFYSGTRATIEAAWVRPREPWWPRFQLEAGRAVTCALETQEPAPGLLKRLLAIHDRIALRGDAHS